MANMMDCEAFYDPLLEVPPVPTRSKARMATLSSGIALAAVLAVLGFSTASPAAELWTSLNRAPVQQPPAPRFTTAAVPATDAPPSHPIHSLNARRPDIAAAVGMGSLLEAAPALAATSDAGNWAWVGDLALFSAKAAIVVGIPAAVLGFFIFKAFGPRRKRAGDDVDPSERFGLLGMKKPPKGAPKEYLTVERLNDRLLSYRYSLQKALEGPEPALAGARRANFERRFGAELASTLTQSQLATITKAETAWREQYGKAQAEIDAASAAFRSLAVQLGGPTGTDPEKKGMGKMMAEMEEKKLSKQVEEALAQQVEAELQYVVAVSKALTPEQRVTLQQLLKATPRGMTPDRPLLVTDKGVADAKHVFVLQFFGDVQAKQVKQLRQEVTAILGSAKKDRGDEVVVVLNTGGGTVTGYGLAAAQLMRLKEKGLKLTICVEEVAASGGYMMACTADRLIASPFAVLGSIGVITEQPNVYERLRREGINWTTTTAGKYKRTLTPFKEPTEEDKAKVKEDIEAVLVLFSRFVKSNRPVLDMEKVATGETWFGQDALERNLCDELKTSDDVLLEYLDQGAELFSVSFKPPATNPLEQLLPAAAAAETGSGWRAALAQLLLGDSVSVLPRGPLARPAEDVAGYRLQAPPTMAQLADPDYVDRRGEEWEFL